MEENSILLKIGEKVPRFSLPDNDGKLVLLSNFTHDFLVLFFYPKDNTTGCALEARNFSILREDFKSLGAEIIGISGGDIESKKKFVSENNLNLILLSDSDFSLSKKFGVFVLPDKILRVTFVLNKDRKVIGIFDDVEPVTHPSQILSFINSKVY